MSSHFSTIGLLDPRFGVDAVLASAPRDTVVDVSGAEHARFVDASGSTIVTHVGADGQVCVTPFFAAPAPHLWRVRPVAVCRDAACVHCSGVDVDVYPVEGDADPESFATRATLQLLHGAAFAEHDLGTVVFRAVVAFAHSARFFTDREAYDADQAAEKVRFAVPSFLPWGMFGARDDVTARASVKLTGTVRSAVTRFHTRTGHPFLHLVVDGLCGPIDVVADAREVPEPAAGAVADIEAWLVADDA